MLLLGFEVIKVLNQCFEFFCHNTLLVYTYFLNGSKIPVHVNIFEEELRCSTRLYAICQGLWLVTQVCQQLPLNYAILLQSRMKSVQIGLNAW